ncbi:MAG TPA: hypothetical protein VMB79_04465 [Jatrophihabitans sp.]|nr:hypothetical protein [Jatrophihabitans sp.]
MTVHSERLPLARPRPAPEPWRAGAWAAWAAAVLVELIISALAAFYIVWGASTTCGQAADHRNLVDGQQSLGIAALVLGSCWFGAILVAPRRWPRLLLGWLLSCLPLALVAATHTGVPDWTGSFCF